MRKKALKIRNKNELLATPKPKPIPKAKAKTKVNRVEKPFNNGTMSKAAFWGFIKNSLRKSSMYWKPTNQCKANARRPYTGLSLRRKWEYECNVCHNFFDGDNVQVDHIIPVGSLQKAEDLAGVVTRLFVEVDGLQCICSFCHNLKTARDVKTIKENKKIELL